MIHGVLFFAVTVTPEVVKVYGDGNGGGTGNGDSDTNNKSDHELELNDGSCEGYIKYNVHHDGQRNNDDETT